MAEPPSLALQRAALPQLATNLSVLALLSTLLLALGSLFTIGLFALNKYLAQERQPPLFAERAQSAIAALQLGRSTVGFAFALLLYTPLQHLYGALLAPQLSRLLALLSLALLYAFGALHLGRLIGNRYPEASLRYLRVPLTVWHYLASPLVQLMVTLSRPLEQRLTPPADDGTQALRQRIDASLQVAPDPLLKRLLANALAFGELTASDLMVPRTDVVWLSVDDPLEKVLKTVRDSGHTRFPLCEGSPDKVIGYLHTKDLATLDPSNAAELRALARPVAFVPETARAQMLLERFRTRSHLAVVVDEFGGMSGIVTLEDLLEALVGDIRDEFDVATSPVERLASGELLIDGGVHLEELARDWGIDLGKSEADTVGGLIFSQLAREVRVGDALTVGGYRLEVLAVEGLRVTRVKLAPTSERNAPAVSGAHPPRLDYPVVS